MLTVSVVNVALPSIATDLGAGSAEQQWVINAYLLTLASLILVGGSLGDRFGRRRLYRVGLAVFSAASLACALAPSVEALIGLRLVQGAGAALLAPGGLAIIEATIVPADRGRAIGTWSGSGWMAGAVGPLLGGALVEISWRWVFVLALPVAAVVAALSVRVPETFDSGAQGHRVDAVGGVLAAVALGGLSFALIEWPERGFGPMMLAAGVVISGASVALRKVERRQTVPIVPYDLFASRTFVGANVVTLLVYAGLGIVFLMLSIQLQVAAGWSPLEAGAGLLPVSALLLVLSPRTGRAVVGPIRVRRALVVGPTLIVVGLMLLAALVDQEARFVSDVLPGTALLGLGLSLVIAPITTAALGSAPDSRAGVASGTNYAMARTGQLLAVAAIPPLVGLSGPALSEPDAVAAGFPLAMLAAAALVGAGGLVAGLLLPGRGPGDGTGADHRAGGVGRAGSQSGASSDEPAVSQRRCRGWGP